MFFVCFVFCIIFIFGVLIFSVELNDESNRQRNKSLFYCVVKSLKRLVMVMAQWAKVRSKKKFYAVAEIFTTGIFTIWLKCNTSANKRVQLITWDFNRYVFVYTCCNVVDCRSCDAGIYRFWVVNDDRNAHQSIYCCFRFTRHST